MFLPVVLLNGLTALLQLSEELGNIIGKLYHAADDLVVADPGRAQGEMNAILEGWLSNIDFIGLPK